LTYPFDNKYVIEKIYHVEISKNGKSVPIFITFQIKNKETNLLKYAKVIVKYNACLG
jgi:hypothetical protein